MDTTDPLILFSDGVCNHCSDFLENRLPLVSDLSFELAAWGAKLRRLVKDRGGEFDCIIGLSGGIDSSFLALAAANTGMRVLGVHMDNGWDSALAIRNIRALADHPFITYKSVVLDWDKFSRIQKRFLEAGVVEAEAPTDVAIQRTLHDIARKFNIKFILSGGNIATEGILPKAWLYNGRDMKYNLSVLASENADSSYMKSIGFGFWREAGAKIFGGTRTLYPLNWFSYEKELALQFLQENSEYQPYKMKHGESVFTRFIQGCYLIEKHGVDYRKGYLSADICRGKLSRDNALSMLIDDPYPRRQVESDKAYLCLKFSWSLEYLDQLLARPGRWYFEYPNAERALAFGYQAYRKLTNRRKGSNF